MVNMSTIIYSYGWVKMGLSCQQNVKNIENMDEQGEANLQNMGWLVVSTPLKNMTSTMWLGLSHILWKKMFQTTNQDVYPWI
jgi:ATP phosphoribosyltransferase regulatory subunit HisZ